MNAIYTLARLTFLEAFRRRIALAAFLLGGGFLILYSVGFHYVYRDALSSGPAQTLVRNQIFNFLTTAGLYAVNFLSVAMAALVSADTLAGEISSGTIHVIAAKPMRRSAIVLGKWIGFAGLLAIYFTLMAGGVLCVAYFTAHYHPHNVLTGISLMYLQCLLLLSISIAGSSWLSTLATGGVAFGLYGIGLIGGWVEQIGAFLKNQTAVNIGIISSLIIPSEALWRRAAYEMTSPLIRSMNFYAGPFSVASVPSFWMVAYAGLYVAAMLTFAIRKFGKRDL